MSDFEVSRRQFIKTGSLAGLAALYSPSRLLAAATFGDALWQHIPAWPSVGAGRKVIILGGGLAGLTAAYSLQRAGFQPVILERTARTGGRFLTLKNFFGEQYAELGATRLPDSHLLTQAYLKLLQLPLEEFPYEGAEHLYYLNGSRFTSQASKRGYPAEFTLHPHESKLGAEALRAYYAKKGFDTLGEIRAPLWPTPAVKAKWDSVTFLEAHRQHLQASENACRITRSYNGSETEYYSALAWLAAEKLDEKWERTYAVRGGNEEFPKALARKLGSVIESGAWVKKVVTSGNKVRVSYVRNQTPQEVEGDFVICTLNQAVMKDVVFEPALSETKQRACREIPMQRVSRLNFQFKRRFWNQEEKLKGLLVACTDTPIERLWDLSSVQKGQTGLLTSYIQYQNAEGLARFDSPAKKLEFGLNEMERFFPGAKKEYTKGFVWEWHHQPWVKGAWASFGVNQIDLFQALQTPEGRVHFAGDHTSLYTGWAQGALESAQLAVQEVVSEVQSERRRGPA